MRALARRAVWVALALQAAWILAERYRLAAPWNGLVYPIVVSLGFAALAFAGDRLTWLAPLLRGFIGVAFLSAIADRLGLFGGPGAPGVSWGSFENFEAYTARVNAFLPRSAIPTLAVAESVIEGGLGLAMLLGFSTRKACVGSATLLSCFALAMTFSLGVGSQFPFAVLVLAAGSFLLATLEHSSRWSADSLRLRLTRRASTSLEGW